MHIPAIFLSKKNLIILGIAAALVLGDAGFYIYRGSVPGAQQSSQKEMKDLLSQIGKLIVLPEGEQPIIATVNDPEQLKGQAFFANAKKGDKVLIYNVARKAILYSPELNRVIDIAPLSAPSPTATPKQ